MKISSKIIYFVFGLLILSFLNPVFSQDQSSDSNHNPAQYNIYDILNKMNSTTKELEDFSIKTNTEFTSDTLQKFSLYLSVLEPAIEQQFLKQQKKIELKITSLDRAVTAMRFNLEKNNFNSCQKIASAMRLDIDEIKKLITNDYFPPGKPAQIDTIIEEWNKKKEETKALSKNSKQPQLLNPYAVVDSITESLHECNLKLKENEFDLIYAESELLIRQTDILAKGLSKHPDYTLEAYHSAQRLYVLSLIIKDYSRDKNESKLKYFLNRFKNEKNKLIELLDE